MKFSQLLLGKKAKKTVTIPLLIQEKEGAPEEVKEVEVDVTPADIDDAGDIASFALEYAKGKGAVDPKDGDTLYDLGALIRTLALTTIDTESKDRAKFFDTGNAGVQKLPRETMIYLHEMQTAFQDEVSPANKDLTSAEFMGAVYALAKGEDDLFFARLRPGTRSILARSMASLLVALLEGKSLPSWLSEQFPSSQTPPPPQSQPAPMANPTP